MIPTVTEFLIAFLGRLKCAAYTLMISRLMAGCGGRSRIYPPLRFENLRQVRLGSGSSIHKDSWLQVIRGMGDDHSIKIEIGDYTGIGMGATISAAQSIILENGVLLARNVYISDHSHAYEDVSRPIAHQGITGIAAVRIGQHTWLGQNVVVLPGVTIGEHCIVGANSVVRSSIPSFSVAVGSPARVVKRYNQDTASWERVSGNSAKLV